MQGDVLGGSSALLSVEPGDGHDSIWQHNGLDAMPAWLAMAERRASEAMFLHGCDVA